MFCVGKVSPIAQRLIDVTHECMMKGIEAVRPGAHLGETVGNIISKSYEVIDKEKPDACKYFYS